MKVKLADAFLLIRNGASIKQCEHAKGIPITRIETISNRYVNRNKLGYANIINIEEYKSYVLHDNDILMSHINSMKHLGKTALYRKKSNEIIIHGMNLLILRANDKIINSAYANYYFSTKFFTNQLNKIIKKSVNQASFTVSDLKKLEISCPSLIEQKHIVDVLDKISILIEKSNVQLSLLDNLVKSRFSEILTDNKQYIENKPLQDICSIITDGTHTSPVFKEKGIPFLFVSNITKNKISYDTKRFIDEETFYKLNKRTPIEINDILLSIVGSYGHPAIITSNKKFSFQRHIAYLKPKLNLVNSYYLYTALLSNTVQRQMQKKVKGIAQKTLNLSELKNINIPILPMKIQKLFFKIILQTDKSKVEIQKSLDKLEMLKKSLMQQYFS